MDEVAELLKIAEDWVVGATQTPKRKSVFGERQKKTGFGSEFSTQGNRTKGIVDRPRPKRKSDDFKPMQKKAAPVPAPGSAFLQGVRKVLVAPPAALWRATPRKARMYGLAAAGAGAGALGGTALYRSMRNLQEEQKRMSDLNLAKNRFQSGLWQDQGHVPDLVG